MATLVSPGAGRTIAGRYRLGARLGTGGMGTVYEAHDLRLDRAVAVKLLRPELAADPGVRKRFEREARAAARISQPNAVAVYDTGESSEREAFIVMELLSGRTLADELAGGALEAARLTVVADGILGALADAHARGIVHRDVKPANVLLADNGVVKLGDFGIATSYESHETTGLVPYGTLSYIAPERLRGEPATPRSDIYSLGVVLYEAAAGVRPFVGDNPAAVVDAIVRNEHEPLGSACPTVSPVVADAVERAIALDPATRFADAAEMRATCASAMTASATAPRPLPTEPIGVTAPTAIMPARSQPEMPLTAVPPRRAAPRSRLRAAVVASMLVLLLVVGAVVLLVATSGGDSGAPTSSSVAPTASAQSAPTGATSELPQPLARALDRLDAATRP